MSSTFDVELASVRTALAAALAVKGAGHIYQRPDELDYDDETDTWIRRRAGSCCYAEAVFDDDDTVVDWVPSCLWGHVMVTLGAEVGDLRRWNACAINSVEVELPWGSELITAAARSSQEVQDSGNSWAAAVQEFERVIAREVGA